MKSIDQPNSHQSNLPIDAMIIPLKFDHVSVFPKYATEAKIMVTLLNVLVIE